MGDFCLNGSLNFWYNKKNNDEVMVVGYFLMAAW